MILNVAMAMTTASKQQEHQALLHVHGAKEFTVARPPVPYRELRHETRELGRHRRRTKQVAQAKANAGASTAIETEASQDVHVK